MSLNVNEITNVTTILDAVTTGVIIADQSQHIVYANNAALTMLELDSAEQILNTSCNTWFQCKEGYQCPVNIEDPDPDSAECTLFKRNGNKLPVFKSTQKVNLGSGYYVIESFFDLSEKIRNIEEINKCRRQYNNLLDNLPGMVYRCRYDGACVMEFVSEGCIQLTGYQPEDIVMNRNISYNDLIVEDDRDRVWSEISEAIKKNKPYVLVYKLRTAGNKIKWVYERANAVFSDNQELQFIEGFISDITQQKESELAQKVIFEISKASYTSENLDAFFLNIHSNLGLIIDVENFYVAMYDKDAQSITLPYQVDSADDIRTFPLGKTLTAYVIKSKTPLLADQKTIEALAESGQIEIVGTPAKVWLGVPLIVSDEVIGIIAVQSYTDTLRYNNNDLDLLKFVADQIAILILRKRIEDSFHYEKAFLNQLFEGSPEAILMIDLNGHIIKCNSEFSDLFGYAPEEITGHNVDTLIADTEHASEASEITQNAFLGKVTEVETKRRHKDGHMIDVSLIVTPITIKGKAYGAYGIYRDITYRKGIEANLIAAKDKAEESDRLKSAFLSNMSHEIRTPMNAILGFSSLLSDPDMSGEERSEYISIIKDRGADLMHIIDDIIDVAKIESGQIRIEMKDCKVNLLLNNLLVSMKEVIRKSGKEHIELNTLPAVADPDFSIMTDGNRLRQIMTNLVENAIKFTDKGHIDFGYKLISQNDLTVIRFFVEDTGIGIAPEMHSVIFERFRQVDDTHTRKYGGTGLGLTISYKLIQLLGGNIKLESAPNKGTTFYVSLPLISTTGISIEPAAVKIIPAGQHNWEHKVILVAEDEESNYFLLNRMLKKTGAKLIWARNGMEAIELCKTNKPDLILMDIRMPLMDGYEATLEIKKNFKIPIIAQTAYALKGEKERSLQTGCDDYISKPIESYQLFSILEKYLNI